MAVVIPEGVVHIGDYAFSNCEKVKSVQIHDGVVSIGRGHLIRVLRLKAL